MSNDRKRRKIDGMPKKIPEGHRVIMVVDPLKKERRIIFGRERYYYCAEYYIEETRPWDIYTENQMIKEIEKEAKNGSKKKKA